MTLLLPRAISEKLRDDLERAYPEEGCGFLLGKTVGDRKDVKDFLSVANQKTKDRARRYLIPPTSFVDAERRAVSLGLDVVGIYHSHPDHPSAPSEFDREHAWPWYSYLIVSVENGRSEKMTSWVLQEDRKRFSEEKIEIKER